MRGKLVAAILATTVIGAITVAAASGKPKRKTLTCTYKVRAQSANPATTGTDLGFANCSKPFGHGLHYDAYKDAIKPPNVTITAPFKEYFDTGTVHGTYKLKGKLAGPTTTGTAKITGGTGAFKHVSGSIKLSCTSKGTLATCTGTGTYTGA